MDDGGAAESDEELKYEGITRPKSQGWSRLKSRIHGLRLRHASADSADNADVSGDGGIFDFLYSTEHPPPDRPKLQPPQIDVSAANAVDDQQWDLERFKFSKPPRAVGLKVAFVATTPDIIGTGGEDSEEPVTVISRQYPSTVKNLPHRPMEQLSGWAEPRSNPVVASQGRNDNTIDRPSPSKVEEYPVDVPSPHNHSSGYQKNQESYISTRAERVSSPNYIQMRADEGRTFLSASLRPGKELRRKPVGSSDSESSSRSRSPATSDHASPPPSRGSGDGIFAAAQYPKALLPSHLQNTGWSPQRTAQSSQIRPSSSGSESNDRGRLRQIGQTSDPRLEKVNPHVHQMLPSPTSNPPPSREKLHALPPRLPPASQTTGHSTAERLEPPTGHHCRSSSSRSSDGLEDRNCVCRTYVKSLEILKSARVDEDSLSKAQLTPWNRIHVFMVPKGERGDEVTLRIITFDSRSSLTDDHVRPIQFRLDDKHLTTIIVSRQLSSDVNISISQHVQDDFLLSQLKQAQTILKDSSTSLAFNFHSRIDLRTFQEAVIGYTIRYDGVAQLFSISRRRMMVSIHKSYETAGARIQILQGHGRTHLVAFFSEYPLANCLQFELRSFDIFEASETKDGTFLIKLVDAKFSLPDSKAETKSQFIALDPMEPASEHEDISIGFTDGAARDEFSAALPASITEPRKFTLKRRI